MRSALFIVALLVPGCDEPPPEDKAEVPFKGPRIALAEDFVGFRDWRSAPLDDRSVTDGHQDSPNRRVYIDRELPAPGEPFGLGTIVVKADQAGPPHQWQIHAMVKRGDGFNPDGAVGWEFFDLRFDEAGVLSIAWRGIGNDGAGYEDPRTGEVLACNTCHAFGGLSDRVFSRHLLAESNPE